ncbi:FAD-binding oxidoreductase [bacterium]|nr:FAD-binding oxidoreductase [bacterium]QQR58675.1 MAG: FAD-binding oxidoreductase [Candidatus Melainabacteria bacterium]
MVFTKDFSALSALNFQASGTCNAERLSWVVVRPRDIQELVLIAKTAQESGSKIFRLSRLCSQEAILQKIDQIENPDFKSAIFLDMSAFNKVIEHVKDDQVISVETGITLQSLAGYLAKAKQWFPASSIFKEDSLLDFIDQASGGHHILNFGGARGVVLGLDVVLSDGTLIKTGGKVVKNVTGYDLTKLLVGGQGIFGIAYKVNLRLFTKAQKEKLQVFACDNLRQALILADNLERLAQRASGQATVQLIDARLLLAAMPNWNHLKKENAPAEEAIFRLKATFKSGSKSQSCLVFFQTMGHKDVVSQLVGEASKIAKDIPLWEFEDSSASYLADFASQAADLLAMSAGAQSLSITSSKRVIDRLMVDSFDNSGGNSAPYWYCQRLAGKLIIAHDRGDLNGWLNKVRASKEACALSYSTKENLYVVEKQESDIDLDDSAKVRQNLISGLKSKLDPESILNPLHSFRGAK